MTSDFRRSSLPVRRIAERNFAAHWTSETMWSCFAAHARERPNDIAVVDREGARSVSNAEVHHLALALASSLRRRGVSEGDVVSVQLPNCLEGVVAALAVQALGCVLNPLLTNYRASELRYKFSKIHPAVVITPTVYRRHDYPEMIEEVRRSAPELVFVHVTAGLSDGGDAQRGDVSFEELLEPDNAVSTLHGISPDAVSEIIFSSGTEATPKAVMHSEQTTNFAVRNVASYLGIGSDDVVWMPSPIGHSTGFNYGVRLALVLGLKLVLQDVWDPAVAVRLINREHATFTLAATTFLQDLLDQADRDGAALPSLQLFGCGGASIPGELVQRAAKHEIRVLRLYGSTELLAATWHRPNASIDELVAFDGMIMPHVQLRIMTDGGAAARDGEIGEIFVRSPSCALGYFDDDARTAETFDGDGWVKTGDLGLLHGQYLTITGRKKEIIIRGGLNITPRELEELILELPGVDRVAVIGLPDDRLGEVACACVIPKRDASIRLSDVTGHLVARGLARFKLPEALIVVEAFPLTASGKVQKHLLKRMVSTSEHSVERRATPNS